jgi:hypothetical protein
MLDNGQTLSQVARVLYASYDANAKNAESNVIDVDVATPSEAGASRSRRDGQSPR